MVTKLKKKDYYLILVAVAVSAIVFMSAFYLTPLRYAFFDPRPIVDIEPKDFYELYVKNPSKYIFLDVRDQSAYDKIHAIGSKSQPLQTLYFERLNLPKNNNQTIVLICSGGVAAGVGYSYLEHYGFRNIVRITGGVENWYANHLPVAGLNID